MNEVINLWVFAIVDAMLLVEWNWMLFTDVMFQWEYCQPLITAQHERGQSMLCRQSLIPLEFYVLANAISFHSNPQSNLPTTDKNTAEEWCLPYRWRLIPPEFDVLANATSFIVKWSAVSGRLDSSLVLDARRDQTTHASLINRNIPAAQQHNTSLIWATCRSLGN